MRWSGSWCRRRKRTWKSKRQRWRRKSRRRKECSGGVGGQRVEGRELGEGGAGADSGRGGEGGGGDSRGTARGVDRYACPRYNLTISRTERYMTG